MQALDQVPNGTDARLSRELDRMAVVFMALANRIARGGIEEDLGGAAGTNTDGDAQKALDLIADEAFMEALAGGEIRHYASEEQDNVVTLNEGGAFALAIDPLDGSSNIDTNVSIGAIFGFFPAEDDPESSLLRPGRELLASGYAIFGPQCALMVTFGDGVLKYVLDPKRGQFRLLGRIADIPADSVEYAINASNYRHWDEPIRA